MLLDGATVASGERLMEILFLDLDGTLLNDQKEVTPGNRAALRLARDAGCRVVVCSGRPLPSALAQARRLGLAEAGCYVIAYNGAIVYDCSREREVFRRTVEPDALFALFDEANRRGLHIQTYDSRSVLVEPCCDDEEVRRYCQTIGMEFRVIESVRNIAEPPAKALCVDFARWENLEDIRQWADRHLAGRIHCMFSSRVYLEVTPPEISKGQAVKALCRELEIPIERAVAAGDEVNDISMLRAAGTGVAVRNAVGETKLAADYVTERDNNHDAIAEIVQRFLGS